MNLWSIEALKLKFSRVQDFVNNSFTKWLLDFLLPSVTNLLYNQLLFQRILQIKHQKSSSNSKIFIQSSQKIKARSDKIIFKEQSNSPLSYLWVIPTKTK